MSRLSLSRLPCAVCGTVDLFPEPKVLYTFTSAKDLKHWNLFSDKAFGGLSEATFAISDETKKVSVRTPGRVTPACTEGHASPCGLALPRLACWPYVTLS